MLDVAVLGLPRSGSTAVYTYLTSHPGIAGSDPKETHFFMDDDQVVLPSRPRFTTHGWAGLEPAFAAAEPGQLRLEATPWHLYQRTARSALASLNKPPLLVVSLRNPAEQIHSMFYYAKYNLRGSGMTFERFVDCLLNEKYEELDRIMDPAEARSILQRNEYATWLDLWREDFPADRLHVFSTKDLATRPGEVCAEICAKLGLDPTHFQGYEPKPAVNANIHLRSELAHRLTYQPAQALAHRLGFRKSKDRLKAIYFALQRSRVAGQQRFEQDAPAIDELRRAFHAANARLEASYGVNVE